MARRFADLGAPARLLLRAVDSPLSSAITFRIGGAHRRLCPQRALDDLFRHVAALDPGVVGRSFASYFAHSAEDVLARIRVPTLIIAVDHDELTPVARAERMHQAIPGSRLVVFPGHAHLVQVERPAAVHDAIDSFLALNGLGGREGRAAEY